MQSFSSKKGQTKNSINSVLFSYRPRREEKSCIRYKTPNFLLVPKIDDRFYERLVNKSLRPRIGREESANSSLILPYLNNSDVMDRLKKKESRHIRIEVYYFFWFLLKSVRVTLIM